MPKNIYEYSYDMRRELKHRIIVISLCVVAVFIGITLFSSFILFAVNVRTESMNPSLSRGTSVFVTPLDKNPRRGNLVLVKDSSSKKLSTQKRIISSIVSFLSLRQFYPYVDSERMAQTGKIRRVVGVPGDTIYMRDYVLYIKPADQTHFLTEFELIPFSYDTQIFSIPVLWDTQLGSVGTFEEIHLKPGEYFLLSDNRVESTDSRVWGPVSADELEGRVLLSYFPLNKIRLY
ncbi:MAG: signal peptidase I [Treponema sp.]|nr:signal peptidase I [Treponema sp.]